MQEPVILNATFNPKVKAYWTLVAVFFSVISIAGTILTPIIALLVYVISGKKLKATSAQLLERKLVVKRGIFFLVEKSIPLDKITDIAMSQGPIMRMFNVYKLSFETAGQSGPGALVSLVGVNDAESFRETILKQKEAINHNRSAPEFEQKPQSHKQQNNNIADDLRALTTSVQNIEKTLLELVKKRD